jgi:hypothetical protein
MKILERLRLQHQNIVFTPDNSKLKELEETKKQLDSILRKWKFGDEPVKSSEEFLNKFEP